MASVFNVCVHAPWWSGLTGITHAAAWPLNEPELLCSPVALTGSLQDGCFFKNQINDGYQAYSAIYHEEYYLGRPCMAVTGELGREEAGWKALDRHSLCDGWPSALWVLLDTSAAAVSHNQIAQGCLSRNYTTQIALPGGLLYERYRLPLSSTSKESLWNPEKKKKHCRGHRNFFFFPKRVIIIL